MPIPSGLRTAAASCSHGHVPVSWHPSGKFLAFAELNPQTNFDLLILPMEGNEAVGWRPGKPTVFLNSRFDEREPMFAGRSLDRVPIERVRAQ